MTQAAAESKSRDVLIRLIRAIDHIEQNQSDSRISIPGPDCDPDSYFTDIPEGFYDKDLMDIQNMSLGDLDAELAQLGFSDEKVAIGIQSVEHHNVVPFPSEKPAVQTEAGEYLQMSLLNSVLKEAIGKSLLLSKNEPSSDDQDKYEQGLKSRPEAAKSSIRNSIAATILALFTLVFVSVTVAKEPLMQAFNQKIEELLIAYDIRQPSGNRTDPVSSMDLKLNYDNAMAVLNKVDKGEIEMSTLEKRALYEKIYTMAKSDVSIVQKRVPGYSEIKACSTKGLYKHSVRSGDTIAKIIKGCGYQINYDIAKFKTTLNINDMVVIAERNGRVIKIELHKKSGIIAMYNSAS